MQNRVLALALAGVLLVLLLVTRWESSGSTRNAGETAGAGRAETLMVSEAATLDASRIEDVSKASEATRVANPVPSLANTRAVPERRYGTLIGHVRDRGPARSPIRSGSVVLVDEKDPQAHRSSSNAQRWFDPSQRRLPEGEREFLGHESEFGGGFVPNPAVARIDASGTFVYEGLRLGEWRLRVHAEGFESGEVLVTLERESPPLEVDVELDPVRTTTMEVVLHGEDGGPLFDSLTDDERRIVDVLQLVLLETCPGIGAPLPSDARRLVQRSRYIAKQRPDAWMDVTLPRPTSGCACAVFADRVLDAVLFAPGQSVVVLTVRKADLDPGRGVLTLVVQDEVSREPIAGAAVRIRGVDDVEHTGETDERGTCRVGNLLVGEASVQVSAPAHDSRTERFSIVAGDTQAPRSISLRPQWALTGRVRFPASGPLPYGILVYRADTPGRNRTTATTTSSRVETFSLSPLPPGEYLVGVSAPGLGQPDADAVRRGTVPGWCWLDLRRGPTGTIELEITPEMAETIRAAGTRDIFR